MVTAFGMSEIGPWSLIDSSNSKQCDYENDGKKLKMSEKLANDIDSAVKTLSGQSL